jgi:hypothetical protein
MLYDLLHWKLGNWHPRQVYATAALQQQKEESLSLTDGWWVELLQEGKLPGSGINGRQKDFAMTEDLVEDAMQKAPRLRDYFSKNGMGRFLRKRGCVAYQERSVGRLRGWRFPPLTEARREWERQFGGWTWNWPDLSDWT